MKTLQLFILLFAPVLGSKAQVYDQSFFLNRIPPLPESVIATDETKEAFERQIDSLEQYLDSMAATYKHPSCALERSSQQELFEYNGIWNELYRMHEAQREAHARILEQMAALAQEEYERKDVLSDKIRKLRNESLKTLRDLRREENLIEKEISHNQASYNQKKADLLAKSIRQYRMSIESFASKTKRADMILLAQVTDKNEYPCAAITNTQYLLLLYRDYLPLFVRPCPSDFD